MPVNGSVYPSQVLSITKSPSIQVEIGEEMENIEAHYAPRQKSVISRIILLANAIEKAVRNHGRD